MSAERERLDGVRASPEQGWAKTQVLKPSHFPF